MTDDHVGRAARFPFFYKIYQIVQPIRYHRRDHGGFVRCWSRGLAIFAPGCATAHYDKPGAISHPLTCKLFHLITASPSRLGRRSSPSWVCWSEVLEKFVQTMRKPVCASFTVQAQFSLRQMSSLFVPEATQTCGFDTGPCLRRVSRTASSPGRRDGLELDLRPDDHIPNPSGNIDNGRVGGVSVMGITSWVVL